MHFPGMEISARPLTRRVPKCLGQVQIADLLLHLLATRPTASTMKIKFPTLIFWYKAGDRA